MDGHENRLSGDDRIRTDDPLVANQVLYQLSYVPFADMVPLTRVRSAREMQNARDVPRVRMILLRC